MMLLLAATVLAMVFDVRFGGGERGVFSISVFEGLALLSAAWLSLGLVYLGRGGAEAAFRRLRARYGDPLAYVGVAVAFGILGLLTGSSEGMHGVRDMLGGVLLGVALVVIVDSRAALERVEWTLAASVSLVSTLALVQWWFGGPYLRALDANAYFKHALSGVALVEHPVVGSMTHPNSFAVFLGPLTALCGGGAGRPGTSRAARIGLALAAVLGVLALACTNAKMAAAVFVTVTAWSALGARNTRYRRRDGFVALAAVCGGLVLSATAIVLFAESMPDWAAPGTLLERAFLDAKAIETLVASARTLLLGGAVESFRQYSPVGLGVHNEYLHLALRYGLVVAVAFASLWVRATRLHPSIGWSVAPALIGIVAILLVEPAAGAQLQGMLFFVLAYASIVSGVTQESP